METEKFFFDMTTPDSTEKRTIRPEDLMGELGIKKSKYYPQNFFARFKLGARKRVIVCQILEMVRKFDRSQSANEIERITSGHFLSIVAKRELNRDSILCFSIEVLPPPL
jgi:hypothetical protein